jgi:hypothetical protein
MKALKYSSILNQSINNLNLRITYLISNINYQINDSAKKTMSPFLMNLKSLRKIHFKFFALKLENKLFFHTSSLNSLFTWITFSLSGICLKYYILFAKTFKRKKLKMKKHKFWKKHKLIKNKNKQNLRK